MLFGVRGRAHTITVPRRELAYPGGLIRHLTGRGANISVCNATALVKFLFEYEARNTSSLPERLVSTRLGLLRSGHLVTSTSSSEGNVPYVGPGADQHVPTPDEHAYQCALRNLLDWEGNHALLWLIGQALAAPFLRRLRVRRFPVTYLAGDSNLGKTTAANFATGIWGTPGLAPFSMQATGSTDKGYLQTLETLGGLPVLIDEAHTAGRSGVLDRVTYNFANGQSYTRGTPFTGAQGNTPLGGAMLLVGEAPPSLLYAGSHNRMLILDGNDQLPLGTGAGRASALGAERARLLEDAWERGAGHLGVQVARCVLADWSAFETRVDQLRRTEALRALQDWAHTVAAAQTVLEVLCTQVLRCEVPDQVTHLPGVLAELMTEQRRSSAPTAEVFETLRMLVLQARRETKPWGDSLHTGGALIGWRQGGTWYIITSAMKGQLPKQAVQLHGRRWAAAGWIQPGETTSTQALYCPALMRSVRVLVIPDEALEHEPQL